MVSRIDAMAGVLALAAHAGLAYGLSRVPPNERKGPSIVEMEVRSPPKIPEPPPPSPPPSVAPAPAPEPERKVVAKKMNVPPPDAPPPNQAPPKEAPKEPPKPVFGVSMSSVTTGDSSFSVPMGNTTMIDPKKSGPHDGNVQPLPAAPIPSKPSYQPVSELYIKNMPDHDSELCSRSIPYPEDAQQQGIEGSVKLRVSLDEKGKVVEVKVLSGPGHGLNEAAVFALKHKCRFSPAIATDGKPVAFVIPQYVFNFQLER